MKSSKLFVLFLLMLITIGSVISLAYVSAQVNVGQIETDVDGVTIIIPDTPLFNNNTQSVNFSAFAEVWLTNEGDMDNIPDLYPTLITAGFNSTINIHDQDLNISSNMSADNLTISGSVVIDGSNIGDPTSSSVDLEIGKDFGLLEIGNVQLFQANLTMSNLDLNGTFVTRYRDGNSLIRFIWTGADNRVLLAIPREGRDFAMYNPRSRMIGGDLGQQFNNGIINCTAQGYTNIDCATDLTGADLGVQDDLEVRGRLFLGNGSTINSTDDGNLTASFFFGDGSTLDINLNDLEDVNTAGVSDSDFLRFSSLGSEWIDTDLFGGLNTWTADQGHTDNTKSEYGDADDAFMEYDGSNFIINPKQSGTGSLLLDTDSHLAFRGTGEFINSPSSGELRISSTTGFAPMITFFAGAVESMQFNTGGIVFNEDSSPDIDVRVESNNNPNAILVDSSRDTLSLFTNTFTHDLNINATSNQTQNATFGQDVTILGTLFGGSPVKIAGINITDNLFELIENRNSSSRFTLQNINESTNATAVISAVNDVGGSMFIGIGSSNFMLGSNLYRNITGSFSKSRGDMVFGNFFNEAFVWLYNPQDDNDPNNLVEVMRLDEGNLNISGNTTSENLFIPQYLFAHTNENMTLLGANQWKNVTFAEEETDLKFGISHIHNDATNETFTINQDGIYDISYDFDIVDTSVGASDIDVAGRMIFTNGTEITGSVFETDIIKQEVEVELSHEFLARLAAGSEVKFQFTATDVDVEVSDHATFGDHPVSASVVFKKIANI